MYYGIHHVNHVTQYPYRVKETDLGGGYHNHVPDEGTIKQQGTPNNAQSRNTMEHGIRDAHIAVSMFGLDYIRHRDNTLAHLSLVDSEILGETKDVTLTNTETFPFNSTRTTPTSYALAKNRKNLFYTVEVTPKTVTGGEVGDIVIKDKALNGFKLYYTGSATKVVFTVRIKGGMT